MSAATQSAHRTEIDLPAGRIRFREAGEGKPVVFVHGYLVDSRLWDGVVDSLSDRCRCLAPDWPIGSQPMAMKPDADLTPYGIAATIASFLEAMDLEDVTIVGNDSGAPWPRCRHPPSRAYRPPRPDQLRHPRELPPGTVQGLRGSGQGAGSAEGIARRRFRIGAVARTIFKPFSRKPIPAELVRSWMEPGFNDPGVKRDLKKVTVGMHKRYTLEAAEKLRTPGSADPARLEPQRRGFPAQVRGTSRR